MATYHLRTDYGARQDRRCVRAATAICEAIQDTALVEAILQAGTYRQIEALIIADPALNQLVPDDISGHGLFGVWWAVQRLLQGHRVLAVPLWRRWKRGAADGGGNEKA